MDEEEHKNLVKKRNQEVDQLVKEFENRKGKRKIITALEEQINLKQYRFLVR